MLENDVDADTKIPEVSLIYFLEMGTEYWVPLKKLKWYCYCNFDI